MYLHIFRAPIDKGHIMRECFLPIKVALGLSYNSPYKEVFNIKMALLRQGGIVSLDLIQHVYLVDGVPCTV